jgi:3-oxoadipate enol-lactonase
MLAPRREAVNLPAQTTLRIEPRPRIAVDVEGSGPLLIFLHGIGGNRRNWRDQLPVFGAYFTAVAWDARGYGDSDDYDGALDFAAFSDDLRRVVDHFDAERAHLCGLSMGGRIAQPSLAQMPPEKRREFIRLRQGPLRAGKTPAEMAPDVAKTLVSAKAVPGAFQRLVDSMAALHKESYLKTIEASMLYERVPDLEAVDVPTHVVVGADDTLTPPGVARTMAERIPGARLSVIANAGHLTNLEQPSAFNAAVLGFLREQLA